MSSGEVLFILAFIVLPTAVLVSSIWAVIFIRRRPDPAPLPAEPAGDMDDEQTAVFATTQAAEAEPFDEPPVTEHDVVVITADDPLAASVINNESPEPVEPVAEPAPEEAETAVHEIPEFQRTEDLDEVVTALKEIDLPDEPDEAAAPVVEEDAELPDGEHDEAPAAEVALQEEPEEETFSETSELPVIDHAPPPAATVEEPPEPAEAPSPEKPRSTTGWRRRKESVKLLPGDPDMPRSRWRNRDPQRQVPQITRPARRRDDVSRNPPPGHESDEESSTGRD